MKTEEGDREGTHTTVPTSTLPPAHWYKVYPAVSSDWPRLVRTGANFTMKRKGRAHAHQQRFSNLPAGGPGPTQKLKENFTNPFIQRCDALGQFLACSIHVGKNDKMTTATWKPTAGRGEQRSQPWCDKTVLQGVTPPGHKHRLSDRTEAPDVGRGGGRASERPKAAINKLEVLDVSSLGAPEPAL